MKIPVTLFLSAVALIAALCSPLASPAGKTAPLQPAPSAPLADTVFILREKTPDYYHVIFIDTNRQSIFYQILLNFRLKDDDLDDYHHYLKTAGGKNGIYPTDLPQNWLPVYQYNKRWYLYAPNDWGNTNRRILNDSAFVSWQMDGPLPYRISGMKKTGKADYTFQLNEPFGEPGKTRTLIIHRLEIGTGLSIFEFPEETGSWRYRLYVPAENAQYFDMIVNYCDNQKQSELHFETPDYEKLLRERR